MDSLVGYNSGDEKFTNLGVQLKKPYLSEDHVESYSENTSTSSSKDKSRSSVLIKTDSKEKERKRHSKSKDRKKTSSREKSGGHVERNRESRHDYDRREKGPVHRSRLKHRDNCERRKHDNGNGRSDGNYYFKEQQNNEKSSNFPASHKHSRKRRSSRSKSREHPPSNKVGTSSSNFNEDRPNNNRLFSNRPNSQEMKISIEASNSGTSTSLPKYYNPSAININKYAEQVEKRKLLWSNKKSESNANKWGTPKFAQDTDGKVASKFMRLMGIKSATKSQQSKSETNDEVYVDGIKKREEMFSCMEQQYEVARQATHSMRGVGLGFSSQPREF